MKPSQNRNRVSPLTIAGSKQRRRLEEFERELGKLCQRFSLDLEHTVTGVEIRLRSDPRPADLKYDWPSVASFQGVDRGGVFDRRHEYHLEIEEYRIDDHNRDQMIRAGILTAKGEANDDRNKDK